jgi:uncharacterized damage-inducible protein DinB
MKAMLLWLALSAAVFSVLGNATYLRAQTVPATPQKATAPDPNLEGIWEGYDGEWGHVSRQLLALAQAIPAEKYSWRPAPGVRSVSEVFMHIAIANFYLLSVTGPKMPAEITSDEMEETVKSKSEVIGYLERSLDAVKEARARLKPGDLQRKVFIQGKTVDVDGMYLRIIVHDNEHMGQLVAYARMNGIVPPWSKGESQAGK